MLLIAGFTVFFYQTHNQPVSMQESIVLPQSIGQWVGHDITMNEKARKLIQPDAMVFRNYQYDNQSINLYLGCYGNMDRSDLAHSPLVCYQGQGWTIIGQTETSLALPANRTNINLNRLIIEKGGSREMVFFWFQTKGYLTAQLGNMRARLLWMKLKGGSSANCFIRVSTVINGSAQGEEQMLINFIQLIYPYLLCNL